jgi:hypothetical protein
MSRYVVRHGRRIEVETLETGGAPVRRKRAPAKTTFAKIPHDAGVALFGRIDGAAWAILIELDRLIFKAYGRNPVRLANSSLEAAGMPRNSKWKALRQLEDAGVIAVARNGREAPLVTHLWHPLKP